MLSAFFSKTLRILSKNLQKFTKNAKTAYLEGKIYVNSITL